MSRLGFFLFGLFTGLLLALAAVLWGWLLADVWR
jgi:hypothetical protein